MANPKHPILKLKIGKALAGTVAKEPVPAPSSAATPTSTAQPKIKLKIGGPSKTPSSATVPSTPVLPSPTPKIKFTTKKKPKLEKLTTSKKRDHDAIADPEDKENAAIVVKPGPKRVRLTTSKPKTPHTPFIKLKPKFKPQARPRGSAYDSEASDREEDPAIEEEFILRMIPGDDCEYVRQAIQEKNWGLKHQHGADIRLKFLQNDGRRAVFIVRGNIYAASLVDMPCIVEGMKSWDRKAWYKAADICQMLLVLGQVNSEAEALDYQLPAGDVDKASWAYAHGLTPPMRWVRKRRFRHRVSTKTIEAVEEEVERLLSLDARAAEPVHYRMVDLDSLNRGDDRGDSGQSDNEDFGDAEMDADGYANADGEPNQDGYFDIEGEEEDEDALAAQFELAGEEDEMGEALEAATPAEFVSAAMDTHNVTDSEAPTPGAGATSKEDSGDDESESDEGDEDLDEDELERRKNIKQAREEIADLEAVIKDQTEEMGRLGNPILKKRKAEKIQSLKADLELKKAAIGEGDDD